MQTPPVYSAIKIKGEKAYELARYGKEVKLDLRKITIYSIKLLKYKYPALKIRTSVSSGTYIRALARDIGRKLSTGAYLNNLRRTKIGKFDIANAVKLDDLKAQLEKENS
jgi:tRNA pseudouridine55 synthase